MRPGHDESITGGENEPWIVKSAIARLDSLLKPDMTGFEWGAGSGTPWYAARLRRFISVEHDPQWAAQVLAEMERLNLCQRWQLHFIPPDETGDDHYLGSGGLIFETYAKMVLGCLLRDDKLSDFVSVDGRARNACLRLAFATVNQDCGIVVLDNSDRLHYKADWIDLEKWRREDFTNGVWQTTIWTIGVET